MKKIYACLYIGLAFFVLCSQSFAHTLISNDSAFLKRIDDEVRHLMRKGDIPGLSLVLVVDGRQILRNYGFSNVERQEAVTSNTLFELGSCSKAFTALAFLKQVENGNVKLDAFVSDYIPEFTATYQKKEAKITVRQILHHTSGIPWETISRIPESISPNALKETVMRVSGIELRNPPGKKFEYATIHYDILALIIEKVTHEKFETNLLSILQELKLSNTSVAIPSNQERMATGYKVGFFQALPFDAPRYSGNNAAGYVISNAKDMACWLKFQMGMEETDLSNLAKLTHQRDETVPLHNMSSYAMGWEVSLRGDDEIYHGGLNPNFTSFVAFRKPAHLGVVVLANSNSSFTELIGERVIKIMAGEKIVKQLDPGDRNDRVFSIVSVIMVIYLLSALGYSWHIGRDIYHRKRRFESFSWKKGLDILKALIILCPFLVGLYFLPQAMTGFNWDAMIVWAPLSLTVLMVLVPIAILFSYSIYFVGLWFPERDKFKTIAPWLAVVSVLVGLANMFVVVLITSSLDADVGSKYLMFYYALALAVYLMGRRYVQVNLVKFATELTYDLRVKIINRIFSTSYQKFEKMDRGRIYTALNDDIAMLGELGNVFVLLTISCVAAIGALLYLVSIAFWATILTCSLVLVLTIIYTMVSQGTNKHFDAARESRNVFMSLMAGMIDGFKEISLRHAKKIEYMKDVTASANIYKEKSGKAGVISVYASLVGETVLMGILGIVTFAFPKLFPEIETYTIMSFVIVLLYLLGPIDAILGFAPSAQRLKIAWKRINDFLNEIPANVNLDNVPPSASKTVKSLIAKGVTFNYDDNRKGFAVGPIDLEVKKGEILFIIGSNGSGKTTLGKLLTGLYKPCTGNIMIDNRTLNSSSLSEHFSTVFSPTHIFEKLYNIDAQERAIDIDYYLTMLDLKHKVTIENGKYSTINLSGGQRKRLALLQCYLEDSPIYLFDEWAADQDPEYRHFFYRTLLPQMRNQGKIIIAITHDDHYFDVADTILKMNQGKLEPHLVNHNTILSAELLH